MHAWLPLALLFVASLSPPTPEPPLHKVAVRIAGPLAMVEVWRTVEANTRTVGDKQLGTYFDLGLPDGAALLDWEVKDRAGSTRLAPLTELRASTGLAAALKMRRLSMPAPMDEGSDYRIHLTPIADGEKAVLHYRYVAVVGCKAGQLVLRMPENQEENPVPAEVTVTLTPSPDGLALAEASLSARPADLSFGLPSGLRRGARTLVMQGTAPARAAWEITWRYARAPGSFAGQILAAAAQVPRIDASSKTVQQYELAGFLCRDDGPSKASVPAQVLLLVDRSRSVGPGGVSAERALARGLIEALPPSVPFNAIPFGVAATPVFALPRMPTREALEAFTTVADPNRLENGTDVTQALLRARAMVDAGVDDGAGADGAGATWIVLLTDGALPASQTAETMYKALAGARVRNLKVLVLLVRQQGDDEVPATSLATYVQFARKFGGLVRVLSQGNVGDTANGLLASMARGGDWLDVRLESGKLAEVLSPGQGAHLVFGDAARLPKERRVRASARGLDTELRAETRPALVKREWLDPLFEAASGKRRAWAGANTNMAIAILPPPVRANTANATNDGVAHGRMDPSVLRNALSLAFMPRARACYLNRKAAKAGDVYLRGRVKLELSIERGELHDAVVRGSTLNHPDIENCVRSAAWAVEYPRPEHRDAPTTANLNLVFQPRTAQESPPDASPQDGKNDRQIDREIELILGPLTFTADFTDLIESPVPDKSPRQ